MGTRILFACLAALWFVAAASAQGNSSNVHNPTWWSKYQFIANNGSAPGPGVTSSLVVDANVDVSNECGPQSETFITLNPATPNVLAAGSNEIFRLPMRGYSSSDDGANWGGVDLPLPPPIGANSIDFGSDPSLAFDTRGNLFYGFIVVFFGAGSGINGTAVAVARSTDGGESYPTLTLFSQEGGENHFNDKPIITVDTNATSPFRDNLYAAWDAALGGSTSGGLRFGRSTDGGASFSVQRIDSRAGPGRVIGADPFVGPNGEVYVAWNDYGRNTIAFNHSFDGGVTFGTPGVISPKIIAFDIGIPAEFSRRALVYPACDADRSRGAHRGRLYCSWMDLTPEGTTDILFSFSNNRGTTWSSPKSVANPPGLIADRFNQWLSVDPTNGDVTISFYDTRNDTTGQRFETDVFLAKSIDGGAIFANTQVTDVRSNEHDCGGLFPCPGIDYGNQQGDYEGLVTFAGVSHPIWTDSRFQLAPATGCRTNLVMEEVFTATVN
jgi:hypothetical protein